MSDDKKKSEEKEETAQEPKLVTLTKSQEEMWAYALKASVSLGDALADVGSPIREFALGLTKLQEAEMWIERGFDMLGIDPFEGDEEDEEDEDEDGEEDE